LAVRYLRYSCLLSIGVLLLASTGCRSTDGLSPEGRRIKAETYETVYTVGSHIPKKVRRGQQADSDDSANPVAVLEGEEAKNAVRTLRGRR
jgi:hypothetical protein